MQVYVWRGFGSVVTLFWSSYGMWTPCSKIPWLLIIRSLDLSFLAWWLLVRRTDGRHCICAVSKVRSENGALLIGLSVWSTTWATQDISSIEWYRYWQPPVCFIFSLIFLGETTWPNSRSHMSSRCGPSVEIVLPRSFLPGRMREAVGYNNAHRLWSSVDVNVLLEVRYDLAKHSYMHSVMRRPRDALKPSNSTRRSRRTSFRFSFRCSPPLLSC